MPQHVVVFSSSILTAGTNQAITPVPDSTVTIGTNNLYVPAKYNKVLYAAGFGGGTAPTRQQLRAPSLREMFFPEITPANLSGSFTGGRFYTDLAYNPLQLQTNEGLNYYSDGGGDGTTAQLVYGVAILGDSSPAPQKGKIFTIYATAAIGAAVGAWNNGPITLDQTLPVGTYDIVGLRVNAAGLVAARLIFIGASAITRPGVFGTDIINRENYPNFRLGQNGIYGLFDTTTPPSLEVVGGTSTAQTLALDLIKRS